MTYHVILLVIISNDIVLSLPIALTYHLVSDGSLIQYTIQLSYCSFKILLTNILFIKTRSLSFKSSYGALQLTKAYRAGSA